MGIVISVVLGLLALAFVLQPLYKRTPNTKDVHLPVVRRGVSEPHSENDEGSPPPFSHNTASFSPEATASTGQTERELAARSALHEIELDYQLGNIAEDDYRTLRERYMRRALRELKARYDREQELDEVIEEQLRQLKEEHEQTT